MRLFSLTIPSTWKIKLNFFLLQYLQVWLLTFMMLYCTQHITSNFSNDGILVCKTCDKKLLQSMLVGVLTWFWCLRKVINANFNCIFDDKWYCESFGSHWVVKLFSWQLKWMQLLHYSTLFHTFFLCSMIIFCIREKLKGHFFCTVRGKREIYRG